MTVSDSYIPFCGISLESMIDNNKDLDIHAYIVCPDLSEESRNRMKMLESKSKNLFLSFLDLTPDMIKTLEEASLRMNKGHNYIFLLRLLIEQLMPTCETRALYIDADTIIANKLNELDDYKFSDNIGAAVVKDAIRPNDYDRLGIDIKKHIYFNAGVMLINLDYWRKNKVGERCLKIIQENPATAFLLDQDALNIVLEGHVEYLHPRYNCLTLFCMRDEFLKNRIQKEEICRIKEAIESPAIIHYVFVYKPWFKGGYLPMREIWDQYHITSIWSDYKPRYRGGYKGMIKHYLKKFLIQFSEVTGIIILPNIFYTKKQ